MGDAGAGGQGSGQGSGQGEGQGAGQGTGQGSGQGAAPAWHGLPETDTDGSAYVGVKGWKAPADVIKSYREAEKLIGRDPNTLLVLPRADDPAGLTAAFTKLGRPEKPEAYDYKAGLPKDVKVDENFGKAMQGFFHKANLTADQAKTLATDYNSHLVAQQEQAEKDYKLSVELGKKELLTKWGGGHDRMLNVAQTTAKALGFTPELMDAIERQVGYKATYEMLVDIGSKLGEDKFVDGNSRRNGFGDTLTPDEAKQQWDAKKLDPNYMAALQDPQHPGHKAAQATQSALFKVMYPPAA